MMTAVPLTIHDDALARRNAFVLSAAQALGGANAAVVISTGGLIGQMLSGDKTIATLPVTAMVVGTAIATLPASFLMRSLGRRVGFMMGAGCGAAGGFTAAAAIVLGSFWLFCAATFLCGIYQAFIGFYRFAAADTASAAFKPKVIAWVLAGGLFAALLGPQLVIFTKDMWLPYVFAASFIAQGIVALIAVALLSAVQLPRPTAADTRGGRPLAEIARQPRYLLAVLCGAVSYALMSYVMTATPLAMVACDHTTTDAFLAIQWHVIGMFAPSFFTGNLIARFGAPRIVATGLLLLALCAVIGLAGTTVAHFWIALILLGVGWNFGFIGATAMVAATHQPNERAKAQGLNDFTIATSQAIASFSAGAMLNHWGWEGVILPVLPFVAVVLFALFAQGSLRRVPQPA